MFCCGTSKKKETKVLNPEKDSKTIVRNPSRNGSKISSRNPSRNNSKSPRNGSYNNSPRLSLINTVKNSGNVTPRNIDPRMKYLQKGNTQESFTDIMNKADDKYFAQANISHAEITSIRFRKEQELQRSCKISQITYPPKFLALGEKPRIVRSSNCFGNDLMILTNKSTKVYKVKTTGGPLPQDLFSRVNPDLNKTYDFKTLEFQKPIYHMDFNPETKIGVFFSAPTTDCHLLNETSGHLL
jgi:hypothetical protein